MADLILLILLLLLLLLFTFLFLDDSSIYTDGNINVAGLFLPVHYNHVWSSRLDVSGCLDVKDPEEFNMIVLNYPFGFMLVPFA